MWLNMYYLFYQAGMECLPESYKYEICTCVCISVCLLHKCYHRDYFVYHSANYDHQRKWRAAKKQGG